MLSLTNTDTIDLDLFILPNGTIDTNRSNLQNQPIENVILVVNTLIDFGNIKLREPYTHLHLVYQTIDNEPYIDTYHILDLEDGTFDFDEYEENNCVTPLTYIIEKINENK